MRWPKDFKVELEVIVIGIGLLGFVVFGKREGVVNDGAAEEETSCAGEVFDFGELRGGGGRGGGGGEIGRASCRERGFNWV